MPRDFDVVGVVGDGEAPTKHLTRRPGPVSRGSRSRTEPARSGAAAQIHKPRAAIGSQERCVMFCRSLRTLFWTTAPVVAPALADSAIFTRNFDVLSHRVKLMITSPYALAPGSGSLRSAESPRSDASGADRAARLGQRQTGDLGGVCRRQSGVETWSFQSRAASGPAVPAIAADRPVAPGWIL